MIIAVRSTLTVVVRLTAGLALEGLQVAVLTVGVVLVTHSVGSLTRPLLTALPLLTLTVRPAGPVRTILVPATLRVRTSPVKTGAADGGRAVGVRGAVSLALPAISAVTNLTALSWKQSPLSSSHLAVRI